MTSVLRSIGNAPALWFILPCLFVLAFTSLYPVGFGLVVSFTNWNWGNQFDFVGGTNYADLLTDAEFWTVIKNTIVFATCATAIEVALGFYLAVQVDKLAIRIRNLVDYLETLQVIPEEGAGAD